MVTRAMPIPAQTGSQIINLKPASGFTATPFVQEIIERGAAYLEAGFAVHFCGPSGSGKTTLAMHLAGMSGNPVMFVTGDDQFGTSDLVGGQFGYRKRKVVDNYVHSVLKTEEDMTQRWADSRLTIACREGFTLVYDEFTRSRPEANNVLLSVLEEKLLVLPTTRTGGSSYLKVHPNFTAIFTSNPEDYAGVHKTQDALRDRMVTIYLDYFDRDTETLITANRTDIAYEYAANIVNFVRAYRDNSAVAHKPTIRAAITIARVSKLQNLTPSILDERFVQICIDVLCGGAVRNHKDGLSLPELRKLTVRLVEEYCGK